MAQLIFVAPVQVLDEGGPLVEDGGVSAKAKEHPKSNGGQTYVLQNYCSKWAPIERV